MDPAANPIQNGKTYRNLPWWRRLDRDTLRKDLLAGLTGAVIVLPQGVALALLAGLPPAYGLYTAIVPVIIAALFGSSHHLVSGPTTAISIVVFTTISVLAPPGTETYVALALALTLLVGLFQLGLGLARLGALVNFISHSVVVGFTAGASIMIVLSQLPKTLGLELPRQKLLLMTVPDLFNQLGSLNPYAVLVTLITLAAALAIQRLLPRWPHLLLAMVTGAIAAVVMGDGHDLKLIGSLPSQLPPLSMPDMSFDTMHTLVSGALAVAILGLMEAVSVSRNIAAQSHQRLNPNQEFIGQGLANIVGSFFSSYASSGSFTRSALNYGAGARTPMAAVFSALWVAGVLLLVAPLVSYVPVASVAAVLLLVAWSLVDFKQLRVILKASRMDIAVVATTFVATLVVELTTAIYIGVILSLILHLNRISHPGIVSRVPDTADKNRRFITDNKRLDCPQLKIIRVDGSLFFGAVNDVEQNLQDIDEINPEQRRVLIICSSINFIDVTGAELLARETRRRREFGGDLYLCSVKPGVYDLLRKGGYLNLIGYDHVFASKAEAIQAIVPQLDPDRCRTCTVRVFGECPPLEEMPVALPITRRAEPHEHT